ncbi:anaphase-promoting complex subunit 2 isoform X1 [Anoplophora glabripennis]|uniref:anaphase-promoting complex subunit 2 isoform X1 n=1 Tax=Anoplophora glabripennis TaxID=217634 RepID=UPI0008754793|nr:anaphase-promoting complex subunit 2 isoform X1 [Anoplophora glabripennis]
MSDYEKVWNFIKRVFPVLDESFTFCQVEDNTFLKNEFDESVEFCQNMNLAKTIQDLLISKIEQRLRDEVVPEFWSYFKKSENDNKGFKQFYNAVKSLYDCFKQLDHIITKLEIFRQATKLCDLIYNENSTHNALKLILKATLLSQLNLEYQVVVMNFYETALKMEDTEEDDGQCIICLQESRHCNCLHLFQETNRKLGDMTLLEPLVGQTLTNLIYTYIHGHIQKICKDCFDSSFISVLEKWLQTVVINWLRKIYCYDTSGSNKFAVDMFDKKLVNYLYNSYTKIRIDQLFNIIIEYPESLPALEDLRLCLPRTDLKPLLTKKLQKAMETRLLHPGVSTPDILTAYVAAIRSLRILDPTGLLLETVTQPVHQYLRSREDTVRCVVSSLTEEGPNDLAEELVRGEAVQVDENTPVDEDSENWETWVPDPVDTAPSKSSTFRRTSDIISMLVNVYGSKELFVNEYRTLLADRLLTQYSCDTEKEIRYLELLKLRFGDSQLHYCEVMLKDIADSKRINQHIKQDPEYSESDVPISAMIVSAQFWPPFKEEKLELHNRLVTQMEGYTSAFETLKGSRTLCWKNHLGVVDLEVELADRTLNLSVSPVQATIMMYFQDKSTWELEELSKIMQCPPTILRRKIGFWQSHGIIAEMKPDVFCIQEDVDNKDNNIQEDIFVEDYESESAMASAQDQREEELQTFWSYIVGMLMNLDTLPLDRIHQMLKMFAFQGPTIECNLQELKVFLDRKVREHQLIYSNGYYKLPK